ncbi:unnamed protein product [Thelazia callipaeda]|uniref:PAT1 domain-containing protein n=1 Tax=Thelazia callipaeda TaxID=103827 RepID=A0A0N5D4Z6_THECL|nr:unnamed protein product [Thelazia callipaeda]
MSRIDLKGFTPRDTHNDNLLDFDLRTLPEDDEFDGRLSESNINAINDETFGVDIDNNLDDDLELYSEQTAGLRMEEPTPFCSDESTSAPDPSELPTPPFVFDSFSLTGLTFSNDKENVKDCKTKNEANNMAWDDTSTSAPLLNWSGPEFSSWQHSINDLKTVSHRTNLQANNESFDQPRFFTDDKDSVTNLLKNVLSLEEREGDSVNVAKPTTTAAPLLKEGVVTLAELEKQLLADSAANASVASSEVDRAATVLSDPRITPRIPPPFPYQYLPFPSLPPFSMEILRGHLPEIPPGFPPVTPQIRAAVLAQLMPPPFLRMPSASMLPPFFFSPQFSQTRPARPVPPSLCNSQFGVHTHISKISRHSNSDLNYTSKRICLPSSKTISDFALSPFAGFVSRKEREWLIKIQQLQCQGCGNPYEDDFYYTLWKQQRLALERRERGLEPINEENKRKYVTKIGNLQHYVPPTFIGSLGKPTLSTVNYPRQLINLSHSSSDDDKLSMKSNTSQKKLRALLLQIENIAFLIIECDDLHRALSASSLSDEVRMELKSDIESRMKTIIQSICYRNGLETALLINKGRQMFARALSCGNEMHQYLLLNSFFSSLPIIIKRVPANVLNESLLMPIFGTLSQFSENRLTNFINTSKWAVSCDSAKNLFLTNLLMLLVVCCSRKDCHLDACFATTILSVLLGPCSQPVKCSLEPFVILTLSDIRILDTWSTRNIKGYHGSALENIVHSLQRSCKCQED